MRQSASEVGEALSAVAMIAIPSALLGVLGLTFHRYIWAGDLLASFLWAARITGTITVVCVGLLLALIAVGVVMKVMEQD